MHTVLILYTLAFIVTKIVLASACYVQHMVKQIHTWHIVILEWPDKIAFFAGCLEEFTQKESGLDLLDTLDNMC